MSDLRDQPAKDAAKTAAEAVFLEYHAASEHWAAAKVAAGLRLTPEAILYMSRENAARRESKERFDRENAEFEAQRRKATGLPPAEGKPDAQQ